MDTWSANLEKIKKRVKEIENLPEVDEVVVNDYYTQLMVVQKENVDDDKFFAAHKNLKKKIKQITMDIPDWCTVIYGNWYRRHNLTEKEFLNKVNQITEKIEKLHEVEIVEANGEAKYILVCLYDDDEDNDEKKYFEECRKFELKIKNIAGIIQPRTTRHQPIGMFLLKI